MTVREAKPLALAGFALGFALGSWNFISFSLNPLDDAVAGMLILYVPMFASWGVAGFLDARLNWRASGPARSTPETQPGEALVSASAQGFDRSLLTGWNFGSTTEPHAAHPLPRRILLEASTSRAVATAEHPLMEHERGVWRVRTSAPAGAWHCAGSLPISASRYSCG